MDSEKDSKMHLETLAKIKSMVESYLLPNVYDTEAIAVDIFIELFVKKMHPSWVFIRNRCIDQIRHQTKIDFKSIDELDRITERKDTSVNTTELVDLLIANTRLSPEEKKIIYLAYYKEEKGISQDDLDKVISKLRKEYEVIKEGLDT